MAKEKEERAELEVVDINEISFADEDEFAEGFDPSEDAFEQAAPIPDGKYKIKLTLQEEDTFQKWQSQSGKQELKANIVGEVTQVTSVPKEYKDEKLEGSKIFASVSTSIPRGKSTCTMAGLLREIGQLKQYTKLVGQIPTSKAALVDLFIKVMKAEPVIGASTEWQAWEELGPNNFKCAKRGMVNFPKQKDGKYNHVIKGKNGEVNAKAKLKRWMGPDTEAALEAAKKGGAAAPTATGARPAGKAPKPAPTAADAEPEIVEDDGAEA